MLLPCEVAIKSVVPAIRSTIALELIASYGLKQKEAANLLGITQTAVSKYVTGVRGTVFKIENIEEIRPIIMDTVSSLTNRSVSKYEKVTRVCNICKIIRQKKFMCKLCKRSDPSIDIQRCVVCTSSCRL